MKINPVFPSLRNHLAERIAVTCAAAIHREVLLHATLESTTDIATGSMLLQLDSYVVGMPKERLQVHEKWPTDWWQAFRERWLPTWWLRRWPVVYRHLDIDRTLYERVCPHVNVPDRERHLCWLSAEPSREIEDL